MQTLTSCPICLGDQLTPFMSVKDHSVSRETFQIVSCKSCDFRFTNPRPDEQEIGKYYESEEYVSHSNTSKNLFYKVYQKVRNHTIKKKLDLVNSLVYSERSNTKIKLDEFAQDHFNDYPERWLKGNAILDIGCGTGEFLNACKNAGWKTTGIEPNQKAREYGIKNYGLDVKQEKDIQNLSACSFDVITMWHVLEHVHSLNERAEELKKLLKKDGKIIIAVPNNASFDSRHYGEYWAAYDVPRHLYHFTPETLSRLFARHGLQRIRLLPMKFDSFYVSMLSEKYKTLARTTEKGVVQSGGGKNGLLKGFLGGLRSNLAAGGDPAKFSSFIAIFKPIG